MDHITVVELLNAQHEVIITDNLSNSRIEVLDSIQEITGKEPIFYQFDLEDINSLKDCFEKEENIDAIIHLAASKAVGESVEKPVLYYQNNLVSLMNLTAIMRGFQGRKHGSQN